jgi:hypothetical protein
MLLLLMLMRCTCYTSRCARTSRHNTRQCHRGLRAKVSTVLGEAAAGSVTCGLLSRLWEPVYSCRMVRGTRGGVTGLLHRTPWPGGWELYATPLGVCSVMTALVFGCWWAVAHLMDVCRPRWRLAAACMMCVGA